MDVKLNKILAEVFVELRFPGAEPITWTNLDFKLKGINDAKKIDIDLPTPKIICFKSADEPIPVDAITGEPVERYSERNTNVVLLYDRCYEDE